MEQLLIWFSVPWILGFFTCSLELFDWWSYNKRNKKYWKILNKRQFSITFYITNGNVWWKLRGLMITLVQLCYNSPQRFPNRLDNWNWWAFGATIFHFQYVINDLINGLRNIPKIFFFRNVFAHLSSIMVHRCVLAHSYMCVVRVDETNGIHDSHLWP